MEITMIGVSVGVIAHLLSGYVIGGLLKPSDDSSENITDGSEYDLLVDIVPYNAYDVICNKVHQDLMSDWLDAGWAEGNRPAKNGLIDNEYDRMVDAVRSENLTELKQLVERS